MARIADKKSEIERAVDTLIDLKQEVADLLQRLDDPAHIKVLHGRYVQYKRFESIAVEMGYSYRNIHYLHGRALQAFGKVLEAHRSQITTIHTDACFINQMEFDEAIRKYNERRKMHMRHT